MRRIKHNLLDVARLRRDDDPPVVIVGGIGASQKRRDNHEGEKDVFHEITNWKRSFTTTSLAPLGVTISAAHAWLAATTRLSLDKLINT